MNNEIKIIKAIEQAESDIEKDQPSSVDMLSYYQHSLTDIGHVIVPLDALHKFFNSKSDANKYLTAEQQEDLEADFHDFLLGIKC